MRMGSQASPWCRCHPTPFPRTFLESTAHPFLLQGTPRDWPRVKLQFQGEDNIPCAAHALIWLLRECFLFPPNFWRKSFRWIGCKQAMKGNWQDTFFLVFLFSQRKNNWKMLRNTDTDFCEVKLNMKQAQGEWCCILISQRVVKGRGSFPCAHFVRDFWLAPSFPHCLQALGLQHCPRALPRGWQGCFRARRPEQS